MALAMDKCTMRVRVRDARRDDVKATTIKEKEKEKEKENKRKYMSTKYEDVSKPKSNLDLCTNPIGVPVLGRWCLIRSDRDLCLLPSPLQGWASNNAPPSALTSSPFPSGSLILRESQKIKERENKSFIGGLLGFECKRGKRV